MTDLDSYIDKWEYWFHAYYGLMELTERNYHMYEYKEEQDQINKEKQRWAKE